MRRTSLNLPRAARVATLLAIATTITTAATVTAPSVALAHHPSTTPSWWQSSDDSDAWSGAGAGWNGSGTTSAETGRAGTGPNASTGTTWTPDETRDVQVRNLSVDRPAISPNGDDEGDVATVSFRLRGTSAFVTVRVVDSAGATVRQLGELRRTRTTADFTWDGRRDDGSTVPDGTYRVVLAPIVEDPAARHDGADPLAIEVRVDTTVPDVRAARPTLLQLRALARRAGEVRDAKAKWKRYKRRGGRHAAHGNSWSRNEREWVQLWLAKQYRLPMTFTTGEAGEVSITARVGEDEKSFETYRDAGRHSVDVVLPDYTSGARASITFASGDDAGNVRRHTVVVRLPAMPAPKVVARSATGGDHRGGPSNDGGGSGSTAAPVTGVPTGGGGPFPDWLDPIMLRATYGAGVPQSWARSQALSNLVFRESSYRPTAQNPTSTAYGLFQFLNTTWATVGCTRTSDAYQQSVCGMRYVQRRYRTPERAWAFWQANHWY